MSYVSEVRADAPVAWWRLGATLAADSSGNARNLTVPGTGWAPSSLNLVNNNADGSLLATGAVGTIANASWMNGWTAMTAEIWVNPTSSEFVFARGSGSSWTGWALSVDTYVRLVFSTGGGAVALDVRTPSNGYDTGTHHLAATYDGATALIYVDGEQQASAAYANGLPSSTQQINVGGINTGVSHYVHGYLDEAALYDKVLSADRIAAHYAAALENPELSGVWGWVG